MRYLDEIAGDRTRRATASGAGCLGASARAGRLARHRLGLPGATQ